MCWNLMWEYEQGGLWGWLGHEGGAITNAISALIKETPEGEIDSFTM